jgi:hypothetical protein
MESDMVDNRSLNPIESIGLVEKYFEDHFKDFLMLKKTNYTGYWWIEFYNNLDVNVCFEGDVSGHFSVKIFIADTENYLWQFDRSVNNSTQSTTKNILYQLDILKRFLLENPQI